jgi:outer membrane protein assembly factor BamB
MILFVALLTATFAATPNFVYSQTDYSWPSIRHDSQNTGLADGPAPTSNNTLWTIGISSLEATAPVVANGKIFILDLENGTLYAINSTNGQVIWQKEDASNSRYRGSSPAVAYGRVFFADGAGRICAFDENTGAILYKTQVTGFLPIYGVNAADGKLFCSSQDDYTYCLNASDGSTLWKALTYIDNKFWAPPAVADGRVFQGSYCFNETDGSLIWHYNAPASTPSVSAGKVFFVTRDDTNCSIICLDEVTGLLKWNYTIGALPFANAGRTTCQTAVAYGKVFALTVDGTIYALNQNTGAPLWITTTDDGSFSVVPPVVAEYKLYIVGDQYVRCFDVDSGNLIWSYLHPGARNPLVVADGKVFLIDSVSLVAIPEFPTAAIVAACLTIATAGVLVWKKLKR